MYAISIHTIFKSFFTNTDKFFHFFQQHSKNIRRLRITLYTERRQERKN